MNQVALIGNITKNPELRHTPSGTTVCNFTVAVNEKYKDKEQAYFIPVTTWGKTAENCNEYLTKGSKVGVEGSLQQQRWEDKQGKKRSKIFIIARRVEFLSRKETNKEQQINLEE
jgi:single-strand DNA-binding protein